MTEQCSNTLATSQHDTQDSIEFSHADRYQEAFNIVSQELDNESLIDVLESLKKNNADFDELTEMVILSVRKNPLMMSMLVSRAMRVYENGIQATLERGMS